MPLRGNSTATIRVNVISRSVKTKSLTCLIDEYTDRTPGTRDIERSNAATKNRPMPAAMNLPRKYNSRIKTDRKNGMATYGPQVGQIDVATIVVVAGGGRRRAGLPLHDVVDRLRE